MEGRRRHVNTLRDEEIASFLKDSDCELDPFEDDVTDSDFILEQEINTNNSSSSESFSDSELDQSVTITRGRGREARARAPRFSRGVRSNQNGESHEAERDEEEWEENTVFETPNVVLIQPSYLPIDRTSFRLIDYFRQYIDDAVIANIVEKSNWSYFSRYTKGLNLTVEECNMYIAITMLMSCINYPSLRMYWSKKFRIPIIANIMARNRFLLLRNALKVVFDEDVTPEEKASDRLWRVRPFITAVLKGCKLQEKTQNLSVDEMIIPFQGICGMKQYCPGKPNPVGLKAFVLATPEGLVCDFDIYQGNTTYTDFQDTDFGLSEKAVLSLTKDLVPGHIIYCDRYFTSEKLVLALEEKGLKCTGTLMKNRVPRSARSVMTDDKVMKKKPRGSWKIVVNKAKKLVLTKWLDSKPVTFLSNVHADQTIDECQRWSKTQRKYISVPRPEVVKLYNRNMGGVDMVDRMLSYCPYRYRTKKWTQRVMSHCIDLAISNSWILYRRDKKNEGADPKSILQLRYFKMEIAEAIIDANIDTDSSLDEPENRGERHHENQDQQHLHFRRKCVPAPIPSAAQRYRGAGHLPEVSEVQRKCRLPGCKMKTKIICTSCKIHLCLTRERSCYKLFHVPGQ